MVLLAVFDNILAAAGDSKDTEKLFLDFSAAFDTIDC